MQDRIISDAFIEKYRLKTPKWGFNGLGYIVYRRTYARTKPDGSLEDWCDTVGRCVNGAQAIGAQYSKHEAERLYDLVFNLKCNFAGRMLWQLGAPTVERYGGASLLNCWFVSMNELEDFCFVFDNLMLGGGVGFSVKREDIHELPKVKAGVSITCKDTKDADFIVPDSREGWVGLLRNIIQSFFKTGKSFTYSTILVRGSGEKIAGFGGTASGPKILTDGMEKIVGILQGREGKKLRSIDVLDINNIIGSVVVAGNVRRSAQIAIGDPDDHLYVRAKNWGLGNIPNWRGMSNNSIYADSYSHISRDIWESGYEIDEATGMAKGEPYGFINLPLSQRYGRLIDGPMKDSKLYPTDRDNCQGFNPCLAVDTWVMTSDGARQIKDLIGTPFTAVHHGKEYRTASAGFWKTGTRQLYKLLTDKGFELKLTANHKLMQANGEWVELSQLKAGDKIALQRHQDHVWGDPTEAGTGWLLGSLVGDGTFDPKRAILTYWGEDKREMLDYATELVEQHIGARADLGTATNEDYNRMRLGSVGLKELATQYGIYQNAKYDLSLVEQASSSFYEGFIRGLFDADGSVQGTQEKGVSVRLCSVSTPLLASVQRMLARLGVISTIYPNRREAGMRSMPDGRGGYKDYPCQATHELIVAKENVISYAKRVGFKDPAKLAALTSAISAYKRSPNRESFTDQIVSIEPLGVEDVYDVTVEEVHAFDANGLVSHNCAEITLGDGEACNLCELYLNNIDSQDELNECARLLYKTQKAIWTLPFHYEKTKSLVVKNMRIGLGVTGVCQSLDKIEWLDKCYKELRKFDAEWSKQRGWPQSIKLTTVKPSGTLSLLGGSTPGGHPAYSPYYIRRVRMGSGDPLVNLCRDLGYHVEYVKNFDGTDKHDTMVVEFPCEAGKDALISKDMTAVQQLDLVKKLQTYWADNAVSVTVYYRKNELPSIKEWLKENYEDGVKSVSFLLHSDHGFAQAPYEEITHERYLEISAKVRPLNSAVAEDVTAGSLLDVECAGGACPVR